MLSLSSLVRKQLNSRWRKSRSLSDLIVGDITLKRNKKLIGIANSNPNPETTTDVPSFFPLENLPTELLLHLRWMTQKYSMGQDLFLCGHPGPLRRRLAMTFANAAGLEVEYVAISRDTTENDLKQRREIRGNSVVFHDQAPVRAAVNGRLLILDGIEYAERNVLPTLNNLLENREMALEDGRFLTTQSNIQSIRGSTSSSLVAVHPDFRVLALGQCVPPYQGRTMDPPLRSRFQSRFVDELSSETILELYSADFAAIDKSKVQTVVDFYESLRMIRSNALHESSSVSLTGLPVFTVDNISSCLAYLKAFPNMSVTDAVRRSVPAGFWMVDAVPIKFKPSIAALFDKLISSSGNSHQYSISSISPIVSETQSNQLSVTFNLKEGPPGKSKRNSVVSEITSRLGGVFGDDIRNTIMLNTQAGSSVPASQSTFSTENLQRYINGLMTTQADVFSDMIIDHSMGQHLCILGPRGCGKSHLARTFANLLGYRTRTFPLYQEVTARDLLQRRITEADSHVSAPSHETGSQSLNKTSWVDSPLIAAARNGDLCILDGIERVDPQVLFTLRMLLQDGIVDLPSGERLSRALYDIDPNSPLAIKPGFRVLALGLSPSPTRPDDTRDRYISSSLGLSYHQLPAASTDEMMEIVNLRLSSTSNNSQQLRKAATALEKAGTENVELKLSLRHLLRLSRLSSSNAAALTPATINGITAEQGSDVEKMLRRMLMIPFMPSTLSSKFDGAMTHLSVPVNHLNVAPNSSPKKCELAIEIDDEKGTLRIGDVITERRSSTRPELIPRPVFHENAAHISMLRELLQAFCVGERAFLLIGNQGVGKNKLVDRLLQLLNAEREYIQLHRDTTIQSLTLLPTLDAGRIVYEDSPMVRAARLGRVLVVDEADKAPVEVVCILKALAEDGEVILYDGRRLLSRARLLSEGGDLAEPPSDVVVIHPNFALFVLANRPGFPFLGNNFFRECGDAFSVHVVENLDYKSEVELLRAYGPDVHVSVLSKLAASFAALRDAHGRGDITYPFSVREAVSVVKHIQMFPQDGVAAAVEDILGFDSLSPVLRSQIANVFQANGLPVPLHAAGTMQRVPPVSLAASLPLASPLTGNILQGEAPKIPPVHFSTKNLKQSEWTSQVTSRSPFTIESSRLVRFTEEIGRINLGKNHEDARHSLWSGRVADMVIDNSDLENGTMHVMTAEPLTLHSFVNLGAAVDAMRGGSVNPTISPQLIKRELLSEDMSYRLGSVQPILIPLGGAGTTASCAVLIPDLSMALVIDKNPDAQVRMISIPLHSFGQTTGSRYKDVVRMFGGSANVRGNYPSAQHGQFAASSSADRPGNAIMYNSGGIGGEIHLVDFNSNICHSVDVAGAIRASHQIPKTDEIGIQSLSSISDNNWVLISSSGSDDENIPKPSQYHRARNQDVQWSQKMQSSLLHFSDTGRAIVRPLATNGDVTSVTALFGNQSFDPNTISVKPNESTTLAGSRLTLAARLSHGNDGGNSSELSTWPRNKSITSDEEVGVVIVRRGVAHHDRIANVIAKDGEKPSKSGGYGNNVELLLEALDLRAKEMKRIDISRPISSIDPSLSIVSVGQIGTKNPLASSLDADTSNGESKPIVTPYSSVSAVLHADGVIRLFETDSMSLGASHKAWETLFAKEQDPAKWRVSRSTDSKGARDLDKDGKPRTGLNAPKHGKEDPKNEPHVGGNTWAGGTGGSDTAGLGGRGGPYRLDKGHTVHQVSDEMKAAVSAESKEQAKKIAREALAKRLDDIKMGRNDYETYMKYKHNIEAQIGQLRATFEELSRRSQERVWLRNQTQGDLDDSKLVDGLTGDRLVFKRRGVPDSVNAHTDNSGDNAHKKRLQFVVDVSGSMYRFNGQDRRLERMLEAVLLLMEAMPSASNDTTLGSASKGLSGTSSGNIDYCISGHSGDSYQIRFLDFDMPKPSNEQERLEVLEAMVAHSQFCSSGDNTLSAVSKAVDAIVAGSEDDQKMDRYVFVMSDANFERYGISPSHLSRLMTKDKRVKVHVILIASLADEADRVAKALPAGHAHVCFETTSIPAVLKSILTSTFGSALDV